MRNTFTNVCKYTNTLFFYLFNRKKEQKILIFNYHFILLFKNFLKQMPPKVKHVHELRSLPSLSKVLQDLPQILNKR